MLIIGPPAGSDSARATSVSWFEDIFDGKVEKTGDLKSEGKAGVVFLGFDGVDGLAGYAEFVGEV